MPTHLILQFGNLYYFLKSVKELISQTIVVLLLYILLLHNHQFKEMTIFKIFIYLSREKQLTYPFN